MFYIGTKDIIGRLSLFYIGTEDIIGRVSMFYISTKDIIGRLSVFYIVLKTSLESGTEHAEGMMWQVVCVLLWC